MQHEDSQPPATRPRLAILVTGRGWWVPRRYAQAQLSCGALDSHGTTPPDSRSISTASCALADFTPYATLLRWPTEVLQRRAKSSRRALSRPSQYGLKSMDTDYHHTVAISATPTGEFPPGVVSLDNFRVSNLAAIHEIRRKNFERLKQLRFDDNASKLARALDNVPAYVNDRLRADGRTIGEDAARSIETKVGLLPGQLDIPDSPLRMDPTRIDVAHEQLRSIVDGLNPDETRDMLKHALAIVSKRKKRRGQ